MMLQSLPAGWLAEAFLQLVNVALHRKDSIEGPQMKQKVLFVHNAYA